MARLLDTGTHDQLSLQGETSLFLPFPQEKMSPWQREQLYRIGQSALQSLCFQIGVSSENVEIFQDFLAHLNDQNTGRKDNTGHFGVARKTIINPQLQTLKEMASENVSGDWTVTAAAPAIMVGDISYIAFEHKHHGTRLAVYERGFELETPDITVAWNIMPAERNAALQRNPSDQTDIRFTSRTPDAHLYAGSFVINSDPTIIADQVIRLTHSDTSREGKKVSEELAALIPKELTTQAGYDQNGVLTTIRVLVALGPERKTNTTASLLYNLQEPRFLNGELVPSETRLAGKATTTIPQAIPTIEMAQGKLLVKYLGHTDTFPIEIPGGATQLAQKLHDNLQTLDLNE